MTLTWKRVEKAKRPSRYGDGHGSYLQITTGGINSRVLRYEHAGRERVIGLGPLHAFNLKEARARNI